MSATLTGGQNLQRYLDQLRQNVKDGYVDIGFMANATYPDGQSVAEVAYFNEFGATNAGIKPRPFFRRMIAKESPAWGQQMAAALKRNRLNVKLTLGQMGEMIVGELKQSISELTTPALKPATIARKGFSKPLIDTGHMKESVTWATKD